MKTQIINYSQDAVFAKNPVAKEIYHYIYDQDLESNKLFKKAGQRTETQIDIDSATITQEIAAVLTKYELKLFYHNMCYIRDENYHLKEIYWHCFDFKTDCYNDFTLEEFRKIRKANKERLAVYDIHYCELIY